MFVQNGVDRWKSEEIHTSLQGGGVYRELDSESDQVPPPVNILTLTCLPLPP